MVGKSAKNDGRTEDFLGCFGVCECDHAILLAANRRRLRAGGPLELVYDLPGGGVESGETLEEALRREFREECRCEIEVGDFLFIQEGTREIQGLRAYCWRSFFYRVHCASEAFPGAEVEALLWCSQEQLHDLLRAPYHESFLEYLTEPNCYFRGQWRDA